MPELPDDRLARMVRDVGIPREEAAILTRDRKTSDFFDRCASTCSDTSRLSRWIIKDLFRVLNRDGLTLESCPVRPEDFSGLVDLVSQGVVTDQGGGGGGGCANRAGRDGSIRQGASRGPRRKRPRHHRGCTDPGTDGGRRDRGAPRRRGQDPSGPNGSREFPGGSGDAEDLGACGPPERSATSYSEGSPRRKGVKKERDGARRTAEGPKGLSPLPVTWGSGPRKSARPRQIPAFPPYPSSVL